ncbi:uncharacterized protein BP5553_05680 [Venustampulla echinocandica]|uniref:Uncharacterized protein n=1 Tax=Venustampulla echinocandica TaxID=2656787 RepID=A0A370TLC4_9HELO|nr:uncharacterized protein BP5553_05680 [Venustampulla echinocandica]RDL36328.1 hypothetical protein BP5553_05680 [Venustampulla echinocandica]
MSLIASKKYRVERTPEMPCWTRRQWRMLDILRCDGSTTEDLMAEVMRLMVETNDELLKREVDYDTPRVKKSTDRMIEDYEGEKQATSLLRSIPKPIVEAMIEGTIGHRYATDPEFARLFMVKDGCPGVYLNTFVVKGTGKGLNSNQWYDLYQMMNRYLEGQGCVIDENSTSDMKNNADEAARIEQAYSNKSVDYFREMTRSGKRAFTQQRRNQDLRFCRLLLNRICHDLDRSGEISQLQSPTQVGCSQNLASRMGQYSPACGMRNTPQLWALTIKCLAVMKVEVEHISVPILKVWRHDHLPLAETLVTELASSMVEYGGLNPIQPGNTNLREDNEIFEAQLQAFVESTNITDDLEASETQVKLRMELLKSIKEMQSYDPKKDRDENVERIEIMRERKENMSLAMRKATKQLDEDTENIYKDIAEMVETMAEQKAQLDFRLKTIEWLKEVKEKEDLAKGIKDA